MNSCNMLGTVTPINNCNNVCSNNSEVGYISVRNQGAYMATFSGSYMCMGQTKIFVGGILQTGEERRVDIPSCATNIHLIMQAADILWDWKLICEKYFLANGKYCFVTYGTILLPYCVQVQCPSSRSLGEAYGVINHGYKCPIVSNVNNCSC